MEIEKEERKLYLHSLSDEQLYKDLDYPVPEELDTKAMSTIIDRIGSWDRKTLIYALAIGDGYINPRGILTLQQGLAQKSFVQFKYILLQNAGFLTSTCKISRVLSFNKENKCFVSWRFNTRSFFKEERELFYPFEKKSIPTDFLESLTPGILAFWYMDDGSRENTKLGMSLDISAFSEAEHIGIKQAIKKLFKI